MKRLLLSIMLCLMPAVGGCGDWLRNVSAPLGGDVAGDRGTVRVLIINNTPHRAVFTFGSYDQTNPDFVPDFRQFGPQDADANLEGNASSSIMAVECGRVFSIGSQRLEDLVRDNVAGEDFDPDSFSAGVEFFSVVGSGDDETLTSEGTAPPFEALLGVHYPCNALLIFRLEFNDAGAEPFRIDFELIPSESNR